MSKGIGANVLITGANRGIGLGLVKKLAKQSDVKRIFAGCRNPKSATELKSLQNKYPSIKLVEIDVTKDSSIQFAFNQVKSDLACNGKLNLLINNAGILERDGKGSRVQTPDRETYMRHFNVNSVSIAIVTATFLPLIRRAAEAKELARIVNISSILGSCTNINGTKYLPEQNLVYSMSKNAVNMYTRGLAGDETNITVVAVCPGWVQTDIGSSAAELTVDQSTEALIKIINNLQQKDSGSFMDRNGIIPY